MTLLSDALKALNSALPGYVKADSYYFGDAKEVFPSNRWRQLLEDTGKHYRINFAATPVDVVTERLDISAFMGDPQAVERFQECWEDNEFALEAPIVMGRAGRFGDSYAIIWPDEDVPSGVAMYAHTPYSVRVFYDPERPRRKTHAIQRWLAVSPPSVDQDPENRGLVPNRTYVFVNMWYIDRIERWVSEQPIDDGLGGSQTSPTDDSINFVRYTEDEENPFGFLPVYHFRNDRQYGRPEHADAYTVQDMVNKTLANLMNSLDHAGYPQRFALSDAAQQDNGFAAPPEELDANGTPIKATNPRGFKAGPGETWLIEGAKSVGQFPTALASNFLDPVNALVKWMGTVTDTPVHLFDLGGQLPSGESQKVGMEPLNKKVGARQRSYGVTWRDLADGVLTMMNVTHTAGAVQVEWSPLDRADSKEDWEVVGLKVSSGVPVREALVQAGYLPDVVDSWLGLTPDDAPDDSQREVDAEVGATAPLAPETTSP
jgi:hypothetical protein